MNRQDRRRQLSDLAKSDAMYSSFPSDMRAATELHRQGRMKEAADTLRKITKVYAAPAFRGSGLAQALFAEALAFAEQGGFGAMMLWSDTRFARGHRFYEKLGFRRWPGERYLADVSATWEYHFRLDLAGAR